MPSATSIIRCLSYSLCLFFGSAAAVNMTYYAPAVGVDGGFECWLDEFYTAAEASNMTAAGYNEFFSQNATIDFGEFNMTQDVVDKLIVRLHYPFAVQETQQIANATFDVHGLTKAYYENGSCVVDDYETKFTLEKIHGKVNTAPKSGSLVGLHLIGQTVLNVSCDSF